MIRVVVTAIIVCLLGGGAWFYWQDPAPVKESVFEREITSDRDQTPRKLEHGVVLKREEISVGKPVSKLAGALGIWEGKLPCGTVTAEVQIAIQETGYRFRLTSEGRAGEYTGVWLYNPKVGYLELREGEKRILTGELKGDSGQVQVEGTACKGNITRTGKL